MAALLSPRPRLLKRAVTERAIAVVLALILTHGLAKGLDDPPIVKDQIARIAVGTSIEVRLLNTRKVRGHLSQKDENSFTLKVGRGAGSSERRVAFDSVKSVKVVQPTHTPPVAWIVLGVVVAVVVVAVAIFLKERSNE